MSVVCVAVPGVPVEKLSQMAPPLLEIVPRLALGARGLIWADARSLQAREVADSLLDSIGDSGFPRARAGIALTPVAAELAARTKSVRPTPRILAVAAGDDAKFIAPLSIELLDPSDKLLAMLLAVGVETCGDLAALDHQSIEVRFGSEGSRLWHLSRADDKRRMFAEMPRNLPSASFEWVEYTLRDPERLLFVINALMGNVCSALVERGEGAREMALAFSLANRSSAEHRLRPARATSSQKAWMRLVRAELEKIRLADAVIGISLRVEAVVAHAERQGDLFDRGFATARATEETIAQMLDDQGAIVVAPSNSSHPLLERRTRWVPQEPGEAARPQLAFRSRSTEPELTLQLLPEPKRITVLTESRRDHELPARYREAAEWVVVLSALGPERVSGGEWERDQFAREYFRCVTREGTMVWIYRDVRSQQWFLHGWWD
ncbi:MAG TPA: hypothetical protein VMY38_00890 [Gemmatimonadaceae bacterium]|nr:hypothetical protein [Gemmatimonadaceae bacterium]